MYCPICGGELNACRCPDCGFDLSQCRETYPTLMDDGKQPEAIRVALRRCSAGQTPRQSPTPVPQQTPYSPPSDRPTPVYATAQAPKKKLWLIPVAAVLLCLIVFIGVNVLGNGKAQESTATNEALAAQSSTKASQTASAAPSATASAAAKESSTSKPQTSSPVSTTQAPASTTAAKPEEVVSLADGSYYAQLSAWTTKDMTVELLTLDGVSEMSGVGIFSETGTVLTLNISRASIVIDGAFTDAMRPIYCSSIYEAMNTYLSGWERTLGEVCNKRIMIQVEDSIIQEVVILYSPA